MALSNYLLCSFLVPFLIRSPPEPGPPGIMAYLSNWHIKYRDQFIVTDVLLGSMLMRTAALAGHLFALAKGLITLTKVFDNKIKDLTRGEFMPALARPTNGHEHVAYTRMPWRIPALTHARAHTFTRTMLWPIKGTAENGSELPGTCHDN